MKQQFFITLALWVTLCLTGCTEKKTAPDYDGTGTDLLVAVCEAIQNGQTALATERLQALVKADADNKFASVVYRQEQKRELVEQANRLLSTTSLNQLMQLIRETEAKGMISPELLAYSRIVTALDQLRLFTSRMPWTTSAALKVNLDNLEPYVPVLSASPAFTAFLAQQREELTRLQNQEALGALKGAARAMDRALITGNGMSRARGACDSAGKDSPNNVLSKALAMSDKASVDALQPFAADADGRAMIEIGALYRWNELSADGREAILAHVRQNGAVSLSGHWLAAKAELTPSAPMDFIQAVAKELPGESPKAEIVREIMERHLLTRDQYKAWCWRSPCPGPAELITRLRQVGLQHPVNKK